MFQAAMRDLPPSWIWTMGLLMVCLLASMIIAIVKLV
jgi:hypothetical protein